MFEDYPDVLSSRDVMQMLNLSKEVLYKLIKANRLPAYRIGNKNWSFNKKDIVAQLDALGKIRH